MKDTFRRDIGSAFATVLKPLGFKKHGLTWQRQSGKFVDLLDVQASQFERVFAVNMGVAILTVRDEVFDAGVETKYAASGTVEMRLGMLAYEGRDFWWQKDSASEIQDAVEKFKLHGPPFFERYHDTDEMIRTLEAGKHDSRLTFPKSFYLALLQLQFGDKDKGCKILHDISLRPPAPWNEPALALLQKYSCS